MAASSHTLNVYCYPSRRNQRNMVSALGHFSSCIVSMIVTLTILAPPAFMILTSGPSGPPLICDFVVFSFPSINFFVYPLIETMCTDILRQNLLELTCCKFLGFSEGEGVEHSVELHIISRDEQRVQTCAQEDPEMPTAIS